METTNIHTEQKPKFRIRILCDNSPENPFKEWDGLPFLMYDSGHDWEYVESCFGFYGSDWEENGMIEAIECEAYGWSKEEIKEILENAEIEY